MVGKGGFGKVKSKHIKFILNNIKGMEGGA